MPDSSKLNRRVHWLLLLIGGGIITTGILWGARGAQDGYLVLTTLGGALLGSSAGWIIEEYFRKSDERTDAQALYSKSMDYMQRHLRVNTLLPSEYSLHPFRASPLHFYYCTKSETGILFWNYVVFDFRKVSIPGRLIAISQIYDYDRKAYEYDVELYRLKPNDPIIIGWRPSASNQPLEVAILNAGLSAYKKRTYGFIDHEDWGSARRISKAILATEPINKLLQPGRIGDEFARKLELDWMRHFQVARPIFESIIKTDID